MSSTNTTNATGPVPSSSDVTPPSSSSTGASLSQFTEIEAAPKVGTSDQAHVPRIDPQTADSILKREHLIHTLSVNGTEILNANLLGAFDPWRKFLELEKVQDTVKNYGFIRGDLVVTARITPPGSCFGAMVFSAVCEGGLDTTPNASINTDLADDLAVDTLHTAFNDLFQVINFEQASTVSMELPWEFYDHYILTDIISHPAYWMWRLQMQSLVPLQSTISPSASANIRIYASLKNFELAVPIYQAKKAISHLKGFKAGEGKGAVSDIASQVAGLAGSVAGHIPFLAPFAGPVAAGASAIASVASFFGFTREASFIPPETTVGRMFASTALVDGVDTSDQLVMLSGSALSIDAAIGGGEHADPMCFESIRQRWGCISYFELTTSTAAGQVLHSLPVTPFYAGVVLGRLQFTPGGYYGLPFEKWRGGMEYMIYIPSSPNMRGMMQICYTPDIVYSTGPYAMDDPTGAVHTVALDLSGTQQHVIQVPYASPNICKKNYAMCDGISFNREYDAANGSLDFYLASPWVAPRVGIVSTRVFILARPMADMVYADPKLRVGSAFTHPLGDFQTSINYQSGVDGSVALMETSILGQALEQEFNLAAVGVTEVAPSSRALVQKFSIVKKLPAASAAPNPRWVQTQAPMTVNTVNTWLTAGTAGELEMETAEFSWYKFYTMMFVGVRGGTRAKLMICEGSVEFQNPVPVYGIQSGNCKTEVPITLNAHASHTSFQILDRDRAVEFGFPYSSDRLYANPRKFPVLATSAAGPNFPRGLRSIGIDGVSNYKSSWMLITAGGSDCSVTRFRRTPSLIAATLIPSI